MAGLVALTSSIPLQRRRAPGGGDSITQPDQLLHSQPGAHMATAIGSKLA